MNKTPVHIFLIIILGLLAYSNSFKASFQFDDRPFIIENPLVKKLDYYIHPSTAQHYQGKPQAHYEVYRSRFVGFFTLALNYRLNGLNVTGYHVVNFLVHIINAVLVYCLVLLSFKTPFLNRLKLRHSAAGIAFFTSAIFVCHPIQTQAVTYIWQRVTSLAAMFYLLSLLAYIKWRLFSHEDQNRSLAQLTDTSSRQNIQSTQPPGKSFGLIRSILYALSILFAVLAMKTKEIAITLPIIITLYEIIFFKGGIKKRLIYLGPILITLIIIPATLIQFDKPIGELIGDIGEATREQTDISRIDYLYTQSTVIMTYIRLLFFPVNQNLDYDYPIISSINAEVVLSSSVILFIFIITAYLYVKFRGKAPLIRLVVFCILWFFITLSVESSLIPIIDVIFEHRVYLPSIGVFLLIVVLLFAVTEKLKDRIRYIEAVKYTVFVLVIFSLAGATYARNNVWKNEIGLWQDVAQKSPRKERVHRNLGIAYRSQGLIDKAIEQYKIALELAPNNAELRSNLGYSLYSKGAIDEAIEQYRLALKIAPNKYKIHFNAGIAYEEKQQFDKAITHYYYAVKLKPDFAEGYAGLGKVYLDKGMIDKALAQYRYAVKLKPDFWAAHYILGNIYAHEGKPNNAIAHFEIAVALNPDLPDLHYNLGLAYKTTGSFNKAVEQFKTVASMKPDAAAHYYLGQIYFEKGDRQKSRQELETALKLNPQYQPARSLLESLN